MPTYPYQLARNDFLQLTSPAFIQNPALRWKTFGPPNFVLLTRCPRHSNCKNIRDPRCPPCKSRSAMGKIPLLLSYNSLHFCQRFASATLFPGQKFVLSTWTHSLSLFPVRRVGPGGPPIIWNAMPIRSFKSLESTFRQCLPQKDEKLCTYLKWHFSQCFPSMR